MLRRQRSVRDAELKAAEDAGAARREKLGRLSAHTEVENEIHQQRRALRSVSTMRDEFASHIRATTATTERASAPPVFAEAPAPAAAASTPAAAAKHHPAARPCGQGSYLA